jgi:antitoxin MazE
MQVDGRRLPARRRPGLFYGLAVCEPGSYNVITSMKTELVRIGNSRGIRIPKPLIDQCGLGKTVRLRVEGRHLIIEPDLPPRHGWEAAFDAAGPAGEDELLLEGLPPNKFDIEEWNW